MRFISTMRWWPSRSALLDEGAGLVELAMVLGQELGGGDEHRAGQARVGVFAALLQRQGAVSVGQRHFRPGQVVLHPDRVGERSGVGGELFAGDVDLACALPLFSDRLVRQSRIVRGHLVRGVVEQSTHRFLRHLVVDQPGAEGMPPLVWRDMDGPAELVANVARHAAIPVVRHGTWRC